MQEQLFVEISEHFWVAVSSIKTIRYDATTHTYIIKREDSRDWDYFRMGNPYRRNIVALLPAEV